MASISVVEFHDFKKSLSPRHDCEDTWDGYRDAQILERGGHVLLRKRCFSWKADLHYVIKRRRE